MIHFDLSHQPAVQRGNITRGHALELDPHPTGSMCSLQLFHPLAAQRVPGGTSLENGSCREMLSLIPSSLALSQQQFSY